MQLTKVSGFTVREQIFSGSRSRIARALRDRDGLPVVLKTSVSDTLSLRESLRFEHEYRLLASLNLSRVIRVHQLIPHRQGFVIVQEDFGAQDLGQLLEGRRLEPAEFLPLARQMAEALAQVHANRIIHTDVNLGNVLVDPRTGTVKLADFGLSTLIEDEAQEAVGPRMIEGTLAYVSPEQTGRTNHPVDRRSDLYSLGVCFYRMLTGQLPFTATDPMELIHSHLARYPASPELRVPSLPRPLSDLVLKLLAKDPAERYQSARGVLRDLEAFQDFLATEDFPVGFVLGTHDVSHRFLVSRKVYGRETEVRTLLSAFDRVACGRPELLLVSGYSGVGKTALVQEVHQSLARRRGRFLWGKHDQFQREIPFSALVRAFRQLTSQLLSESDDRVDSWRQALTGALGRNARVIVDVLPELEFLLGPQAPVPDLGGIETKNRFLSTFRRFVGVFARPEHPLVVFLDDLQWADTSSLQLIELLCLEDGLALLVLGAYRDNEVSPSHPLMDLLRHLDEAGAKVGSIQLSPLGLEETNRLVSDTLAQSEEGTRPLSALLQEKTGGNPFFLCQTLGELHARALFVQEESTGRWTWDLDRMRSLEMTDNVIDLMVRRINRLSRRSQEILELAACIGNQFTLEVLATIDERPEAETGSDLWETLREGLILQSGAGFRFLHDRVQQAAYSLIAPGDLEPLHLKIGRLLASQFAGNRQETWLFDIVGHFHRARDLVSSPEERAYLAGLNLRAGKKAKRSAAHLAALSYFQAAMALLPDEPWTADYELTLELHTEAVSAAFSTGDYSLVEAYGGEVLARARTILDMVPVYRVKSDVCVSENRARDGILTVLPVLAELGVVFPANPGPDDIQAALGRTAARLAENPVERLVDLPLMTDPGKLAAMEILVGISASSYQSFPALFPLVVFEQVNLSLDFGNCELSPFGYMAHAMIVGGLQEDFDLAFRLGQVALDLARKLDARMIYGRILFLFNNNIRHHKVPLAETLPDLAESAAITMELGDPEYSCLTRLSHLQHLFYVGEKLEKVQAEMAFSAAAMKSVKQEVALRFTNIYLQTVRNLVGNSAAPWVLAGEAFDESVPVEAHDVTTVYCLKSCKAMLELSFDRPVEAERSAQAAVDALEGAIGLAGVPLVHFYDCLAKLSVVPDRTGEERDRLWASIGSSQAKLKSRADHCPQNHLHRWLLVEAERQRVLGNPWEAVELYDEAIGEAKKSGAVQDEALANELAAKFWFSRDKPLVGRAYLSEAHSAYDRWGAWAKVRSLEGSHPFLRPSTTESRTDSHDISRERLDLLSVLKAAQAISGEIQLDVLLEKILGIVIENAGAEEGLLLLPGDEDWFVAARALAAGDQTRVGRSPLKGSTLVCESMVRFVIRTRQDLALDDAARGSPFQDDPHVAGRGIRSVLCLPLVSRSRLSGVLYLENNLTAGAFGPERSQVPKMLSAQVSTAIENALLYQSLERKVTERTAALEELSAGLEERVRHRTVQLEEVNRELEAFSYSMSHELRAPLRAIDGCSALIAERSGERLDDESRRLFGKLRWNAQRMGQLLDDLLAYARTVRPANPSRVEMAEMARSAFLEVVRASGGTQRISFQVGDLPTAFGDPSLLRQVWLSLLSNAVKFSGTREEPVIDVSCSASGATAVYRVSDNGVGFDMKYVDKLFGVFQRLHGIREFEGTGTGLALVRKIVALHGGRVWAEGAVDQGATFSFTLGEASPEPHRRDPRGDV